MRGAVLYGPRDVRFEERGAPRIIKPTDAIIRMSATCVCGGNGKINPGKVFDLTLPLTK